MENLIIYPENQKQLQILKSLLEEMKIKFKSEVLETFHSSVFDLFKLGLIDTGTMNKFDKVCPDKTLTGSDIETTKKTIILI